MNFKFSSSNSKIIPIIFFSLIVMYSTQSWALVGVGGHVPFGFSTQKKPEGGDNKTTFHPMVSLNGVYNIPFNHVALPEFGIVFHRNNFDEVKKKTIFILWDVGWLATDKLVLRYGFGTFMTKIGGDGGNRSMPNGDSTAEFAMPDETRTSYNTTINLGMDFAVDQHYTVKAETFIFNMFSSQSRALSYALSFNYYL
jgi:hypothetical protein